MNMAYCVETYTKLIGGVHLILKANGSCYLDTDNSYEIRRQYTINKMACYSTMGHNSAKMLSHLFENTCDSVPVKAKLFVAKECKTQRDTFRNSGYSITINKDKAQVVVVPDVVPGKYGTRTANLVAKDDENDVVYLIHIARRGYPSGSEINLNDMEIARDFIIKDTGWRIEEMKATDVVITFMPRSEELKEILCDTKTLTVPYVQESKVPIIASTHFSPETLTLWENIEDTNLLTRTICTSNWMDYPVTLLMFLYMYNMKGGRNVYWNNEGNADFKRILNQIRYEVYLHEWNDVWRRDISAMDYDMLQKYVYYKLGIPETGGMISEQELYASVPKELVQYLQHKIVFKPIEVPSKTLLRSIKETIA